MFDIDLQSRVPIYEQLYRKIVELAVKGVLPEGTRLPSVRQLAKDLSINPNTVMQLICRFLSSALSALF